MLAEGRREEGSRIRGERLAQFLGIQPADSCDCTYGALKRLLYGNGRERLARVWWEVGLGKELREGELPCVLAPAPCPEHYLVDGEPAVGLNGAMELV